MHARRTHRPHAPQPHGPILLPRWQRWFIWSALAVLAASGLLWLGLHGFAPAAADDIPHDATGKLWCIRIHAAAALLTLTAVGSLLPIHVRSAWRVRKNRLSGVINLIILGTLAVTGYALWYASEGGLRQWSAWLHWGLGCAVPLALLGHVGLGRAAERRLKRERLSASNATKAPACGLCLASDMNSPDNPPFHNKEIP